MSHLAKLSLSTALTAALGMGCHGEFDTGSANWEVTCSTSETRLLAGQSIDIGTVSVSQDETLLCVTFELTQGDWYITENHIALAADPADLPQNGAGNPQVGQFPYSRTGLHTQSDTHCVDYVAAGFAVDSAVYLAAHAVVQREDGNGQVLQSETAWGEGPEFSGRSWAMYFDHTLETCVPEPVSCPPTVTVNSPIYMSFPRSYGLEDISLADCASISFDPACDPGLDIDTLGTIVSVSSDEPVVTANHDCNAEPEACIDIEIADNSTCRVRNTRDSYGDGRIYTIEFTVDDGAGNTSAVYSCQVGVRLWDTQIPVAGPAAYTVYP